MQRKDFWIITLRAIPFDQVTYAVFLDILDQIAKQAVL